ncbi:hypothetical protein N481_18715 [Pseudoalteromonas luteoviolacea S4047-1]|uniref:Uncharacterized protein n=1 Tax=Pseudoalteromonas luteoviolacea S4054 TaxID=1129367 RepID=A0A0F6A5E0_9GAMM|nr:hypothetical protein N479_02660 [Pseudoalteromonas luteoviolacea S4054]KZN71702.1 hypothetical protein N481_18715 [Pseudoalteromonas luteoviolacea S4047-1]
MLNLSSKKNRFKLFEGTLKISQLFKKIRPPIYTHLQTYLLKNHLKTHEKI